MLQYLPWRQRRLSAEQLRGRLMFYLPWEFDRLGGVDVVVDELYAGLQHHALEPLIGIQSWHRAGHRQDEQGRQFLDINLPSPPTGRNVGKWLRYVITLLRRLPVLCSTLRRENIEVANCHFPTTHLFPLALLKALGLWSGVLVLSFHGSEVKKIDMRSAVWRLIRGATTRVTCCSAYLASELATTGFCRADEAVIVYNGIDAAAFATKTKAGSLQLPHRYIASVSNFVPTKGQDILLQAFALLSKQVSDVHLVLAGGRDNGDWLDYLRGLAADLKIERRVHFAENVRHESVAQLMAGAVCLAHTSWAESFGIVLIEAGAVGTPVIAPKIGGIPEVLGDDGCMYPAGDANALAGLLQRYIYEPEHAAAEGLRLKQRVLDNFSVTTQCSMYAAALQNKPDFPALPKCEGFSGAAVGADARSVIANSASS